MQLGRKEMRGKVEKRKVKGRSDLRAKSARAAGLAGLAGYYALE